MWWLLAIGLLVVVVLVLWRRRGKAIPLVEARVSSDGIAYSVDYETLHPEVQPVEYLWIVLCTAARFVYIVGENDFRHPRGREGVVKHIASLGRAISSGFHDLFSQVGPEGAWLVPTAASEARALRARLYYRDPWSRTAMTFLPASWHPLQFHGTLTALAVSGREKLHTPYLVALLGAALESLAEGYEDGRFDPRSVKSLYSAPVEAFHAAKDADSVIGAGILDESDEKAETPSVDELERRAERLMESGEFAGAVQALKDVIRKDPTRLHIYERLMAAYVRWQRPSDALAQYRALVGFYQERGSEADLEALRQRAVSLGVEVDATDAED